MGHMLKTSERLQQGAKLYYQQFMSKVAVDMNNKPNVDYPNKIERYYFKEVIYLTNEKAEIVLSFRTYYKKVEGYRQYNYHKYRVLSNTLYKEKFVSIKVDLNPIALNNLKNNSITYVSMNATGIISAIRPVECYPTWAQKVFLDAIHKSESERLNKIFQERMSSIASKIKKAENIKSENLKLIENELENQRLLEQKQIRIICKSIKLGFKTHKFLRLILSLGLNNLYFRYRHLKLKAEKLQFIISDSIAKKESLIIESHKIENQLTDLKNEKLVAEANGKFILMAEDEQYVFDSKNIFQPFKDSFAEINIQEGKPLILKPVYKYFIEHHNVEKEELDEFVDLDESKIESFKGLSVIGLFIIRNVETESLYLGYSFDIEKSVKSIFKKNKPKNRFMLKEYNESNNEDKKELFKIKVYLTKNEQDLFEKYKLLNCKYDTIFIRF